MKNRKTQPISDPTTAAAGVDPTRPTLPDPAAVGPPPPVPPPLTDEDHGHLQAMERKLQLVRDRVAGVVDGTATGFYLYGPGRVSKSHTVKEELDRLRADYVLFNSRATGRGLFNILRDHPDSVVVLEDMEKVFRD